MDCLRLSRYRDMFSRKWMRREDCYSRIVQGFPFSTFQEIHLTCFVPRAFRVIKKVFKHKLWCFSTIYKKHRKEKNLSSSARMQSRERRSFNLRWAGRQPNCFRVLRNNDFFRVQCKFCKDKLYIIVNASQRCGDPKTALKLVGRILLFSKSVNTDWHCEVKGSAVIEAVRHWY